LVGLPGKNGLLQYRGLWRGTSISIPCGRPLTGSCQAFGHVDGRPLVPTRALAYHEPGIYL